MKKVSDIMTKEVVSVDPETKITEVAKILFKNRFHGVPVVEKRKIVGIITETDFFTKDSANLYLPSYINFLRENKVVESVPKEIRENIAKLTSAKAKDIMTPGCVSILRDMNLSALLQFFKTTKFYTLPVIDESENLVGIVTQSDVIRLISGTKM